jgi:outer membrane immunogenic protein
MGVALACSSVPGAAEGPVYKAAPFSWSGLYAGANAGYGWATGGVSGGIGGLQAGYNWQTGNLVLGIESDVQISGQKGSASGSNAGVTLTETDKVSWFGTTRLRAGFAADRWFFYGTGGLAYGRIKIDGVATGLLTGAYSASNTKTGWTGGAGVEAAIDNKWSWKLEYLYASFSGFSNTYVFTGVPVVVMYPRINENIVRAGLNYRF